jgi:hypothetical protein
MTDRLDRIEAMLEALAADRVERTRQQTDWETRMEERQTLWEERTADLHEDMLATLRMVHTLAEEGQRDRAEIRADRSDIRTMQTEIREIQADIRGLQIENRRILDYLLNQQSGE